MFAKSRLFHTADKSALVHEDSEDAAFLYANTGDEIPESAAELYGLVDGDLPEAKGRSGSANKGGKPQSDKAVELTSVKGIGAATAKALTAGGIDSVEKLAAVNPLEAPTLEGVSATFNWAAVVVAAAELVPPAGEGGGGDAAAAGAE